MLGAIAVKEFDGVQGTTTFPSGLVVISIGRQNPFLSNRFSALI